MVTHLSTFLYFLVNDLAFKMRDEALKNQKTDPHSRNVPCVCALQNIDKTLPAMDIAAFLVFRQARQPSKTAIMGLRINTTIRQEDFAVHK
jgi:hypothetical protein